MIAFGAFRPEVFGNLVADDGLSVGDFPEMRIEHVTNERGEVIDGGARSFRDASCCSALSRGPLLPTPRSANQLPARFPRDPTALFAKIDHRRLHCDHNNYACYCDPSSPSSWCYCMREMMQQCVGSKGPTPRRGWNLRLSVRPIIHEFLQENVNSRRSAPNSNPSRGFDFQVTVLFL